MSIWNNHEFPCGRSDRFGFKWSLLGHLLVPTVGTLIFAMAFTTARAQDFIEVNYVDPEAPPQRVVAVCVDKWIVEPVYADVALVSGGKRVQPEKAAEGFQRINEVVSGGMILAIAPGCLDQFRQAWSEAGNELDQLSFHGVVAPKEADDSDELSEEAIQVYRKEAENQYERCVADYSFSSYWDCKCIKGKFMEARIEKGPDIHSQTILVDIHTQCPNPQGVADMTLDKCKRQSGSSFFRSIDDFQAFCSCVSESVSKAFAADPSKADLVNGMLTRNAWRACGL